MASVTKENEGNRADTPDDPDEGEKGSPKGKGGSKGDDVRALDSAKRTDARPAGFFTIYKKGQGYWTRMGTLVAVMVIGVMLAYTIYKEVPNYGGSADVTALNARERELTEQSNKLADEMAKLKVQLTPTTPLPSADSAALTATYNAKEAEKTKVDAGIKSVRDETAAANLAYQVKLKRVAGSIAGGFLAVFAGLGLWMMNKPRYVDFMIATDSEMKKVNWTSRRELIGSSKVVIAFMFLMALYLFVNDVVFGYLMYLIRVLKVPPPPFS